MADFQVGRTTVMLAGCGKHDDYNKVGALPLIRYPR